MEIEKHERPDEVQVGKEAASPKVAAAVENALRIEPGSNPAITAKVIDRVAERLSGYTALKGAAAVAKEMLSTASKEPPTRADTGHGKDSRKDMDIER